MRNVAIYLVVFLCFFLNKAIAQESFEAKAKAIAYKIERITNQEKETLKFQIEEVNAQLEKGLITQEQANEKKMALAKERATIIENKIAAIQVELKDLVQQKVDGKINENDKKTTIAIFGGSSGDSIGNTFAIELPAMKVYDGQKDKEKKLLKRTTSQFVFALGLNNVATNTNVANSDFRYFGSHFYEWGLTYNSRISKNNNLLHFKYGFSVMYNNLRATNNRYFVTVGNQTSLNFYNASLDESRFKNVYLVFPFHLEFDFSNNKSYAFKTHDSFRIGLGGYLGTNLKSKQYLEYSDIEILTKSDFNTSNFIYGLSTYIGYKATSLYVKYDLNPLFKNNTIKQNNVSLGIRWDFN
jgi:hypothetical protein